MFLCKDDICELIHQEEECYPEPTEQEWEEWCDGMSQFADECDRLGIPLN